MVRARAGFRGLWLILPALLWGGFPTSVAAQVGAGVGAGASAHADHMEPQDHPLARPDEMRGVYLNAWIAGSARRSGELIDLASRTEINTFVIDVKDASGYVSYETSVPFAHEIGADGQIRIPDVRGLLSRLEAEGIWPVARIVVFKDPLIASARPDMAVQDSAGGAWVDGGGDVWVNPWDPRVWDYHVDLAREAVELGFREIQWDYIRFPDRPASELAAARFPGSDGRARPMAVREFLVRARAGLSDLDVPMTGDVFGVTATSRGDVGIGQVWESVVDLLDAVHPMIYPSHYWSGSFGHEQPNAHPYEIVARAMEDALERNEGVSGAGEVIPWLQDFTLGEPAYAAAEVRAQIVAARDVGRSEWLLWNASSRYTEEALEPAGGWPDGLEPAIRVGGRVVSADRRFEPPPVLEPTLEFEPEPAVESVPRPAVEPMPEPAAVPVPEPAAVPLPQPAVDGRRRAEAGAPGAR